jgi:hypothetical protein
MQHSTLDDLFHAYDTHLNSAVMELLSNENVNKEQPAKFIPYIKQKYLLQI